MEFMSATTEQLGRIAYYERVLAALGLDRKLTAEEYSKLPEVIGFRDELIEGERVLTAMPLYPHTVVIKNLEVLLERQFPGMHVARESGWKFVTSSGLDSVPGPDLMVITTEDHQRAAKSGGYFQGRPQFVIEVVSPSEKKFRRLQKVGLYLEAGAGAVVEVVYTKRNVLVHRPDEEFPEHVKDRITWPFTAEFAEIFAGI
jgi:Uma2 family endonuclease